MLGKSKRLVWSILVVVLSLTVILSGCAQQAPQGTAGEGGEFRFGMISGPSSLDPAFLEEVNGIEIGKELYDGLVAYNFETSKVEGALAEKWDISPDNLKYTFTLRKGVKFHDGSEVKADDVLASWNRLAAKDTKATVSFPLEPVSGYEEMQDGSAKELKGLKKIDDYTVEVTLKKPHAPFLLSLTHPAASIYKVAAAVAAGENFGTPSTKPEQLIGAGPFKFVEWKSDQNVTLAKFNDYYGNKSHVDKVTYRIFKDESTALNEFRAGNLEFVDMLPPGQRQALIKEFPDQTPRIVTLTTQYIGFNVDKPPFKDNVNLRKAISYAIDRKSIIDTVLEGISAEAAGPLPKSMPGFNKDLKYPTYDVVKAKEYLKAAGYPDGKGLPVIELKYNFNQLNKTIMEAVQGQLKQIGIETKLINLEWAAYIKDLQSGNSQMFRLAWGADYPDPDNFLYALYTKAQAGLNNDTFYSNPDVEKLLDQGRVETDQAKRNAIYQQAEQKIVDDAPAAWLFNTTYMHLFSKNVKDLYIDPLDQKNMSRVKLVK
ncbi:MAG: ABC transporter substrate-binding protein [Desulfitobacteriaceae bacterium]